MNFGKILCVTSFAGMMAASGTALGAPVIDIWAMSGAGDGRLWSIDVGGNTNTLVGRLEDPLLHDVGSGWSTVGETPDKTLYFMRRFQNDIHMFSLDSTNIQVTGGVITNVMNLGSTGLGGNLDGLTAGPDGNLHPMQRAFIHFDAFQCGFCTPGQLCSAVALIDEHKKGARRHLPLSDDEIREQMSGNLCRCGAYSNIVAAVREVATHG